MSAAVARPPFVELDGVTHVYEPGSVRALDGIRLRIAPGEQVALIGQNGSGKTTLVRHLVGLLRPTGGQVRFDGHDVRDRTVAELARTVGLVFQDPDRQIFAGSVRAEVEFGPRNVGLRRDDLRAATAEALAAVGLEAEAATNPYDLGSSRRKLLALGSVLAMKTPVLVLDEPTTGQDLRGVALVQHIIESARATGRTVIAVSHDMEFVAENFGRVIVMGEGRVILDGAPATVFGQASWNDLRATYLEPPLAARIGAGLGVGDTPTIAALLAAVSDGST